MWAIVNSKTCAFGSLYLIAQLMRQLICAIVHRERCAQKKRARNLKCENVIQDRSGISTVINQYSSPNCAMINECNDFTGYCKLLT